MRFGKPLPGRENARPLGYLEYTRAGLRPCTFVATDPKTGDIEFLRVGRAPELLPVDLSPAIIDQARRELLAYWQEGRV
ncbi:MAG: hypothetical protein WBG50_02230 [Desulfomonilaceae bacterium]